MRGSILVLTVLSCLSLDLFAASPEPRWVEGQILVRPQNGLSNGRFQHILGQVRGRSVKVLPAIGTHIVSVAPAAEDAVIRALSSNPHIDYAERDGLVEPGVITPDDPSLASQWHLPGIQAPEAWDSATGEGITVAILDTGVEDSHPDLAGNLTTGRNVVSNNDDTSPIVWHGTSVAGAVAASTKNATGVASVAWNARIMPIRITNRTDGVAAWSDMAAGFIWAADHGADVANLSYGLSAYSNTLNNALQYLRNEGGVAVAAAGNENTDKGLDDNPYLITVAATTSSDTRAGYSNYGDDIDIAALGSRILSTYTDGQYRSVSGTSFASPVAAGVLALIKAANPALTPMEMEEILEASAQDRGASGWDPFFGHGRIDALVAVQAALQGTTPDTQAPEVAIVLPANAAVVSGIETVEVDASDNTAVSEVALYVEGQLLASDSTAPYQFSWDTTGLPDGPVTLTAYAFDSAGNTAISPAVAVEVRNETGIDSDGDDIPDTADDCLEASNIDQLDSDGDNIGNACDCDFNQDNFCGGPDFTIFIGCFNAAIGGDQCARQQT